MVVAEESVDEVADGLELLPVWRSDGRAVDARRQLVAVVAEFLAPLGECLEPGCAQRVAHRAQLERAQVTVDRRCCLADLRLDAGQFLGELWLLLVDFLNRQLDGPLEEVEVVVGGHKGVDDGFFEVLGADSVPLQARLPVPSWARQT